MPRSSLVLALLALPSLALADEPPRPTAPILAAPTVLAVTTASGTDDTRLGESLHVTLPAGAVAQLRGPEHKPLQLVLDGNVIPGLPGLDEGGGDGADHLRFDLERTADNHDAWAPLLGRGKAESVVVTVQGAGGRALPATAGGTIRFRWWQRNLNWIPAFAILLIAVLVLVLPLFTTSMYRDPGTGLATPRLGVRDHGTFSLARCQIGFWFLNVVVAYTAIWAMTGATDAITPSVLAIIGIGSGTLLGAALIDQPRRDDLAALRVEHAALAARARDSLSPDEMRREADLRAQLCSAGPVRDLLTDDNGWSFHRVQLVVWTLVMFVLFWSSMVHHFALPDFDASLLSILGISSGTYVGLKMPENSQRPATPPPPAPPATPAAKV